MTYRSWKYTAMGILAAIAITAPIAVALVALYTVIGGSSIYGSFVLMYWVLLVTLGIGVSRLLHQYEWSLDRSIFPTNDLPGQRLNNQGAKRSDIYLIVGFLMSGYSIFVAVLLGISVLAGLYFGILGSALIIIGVVTLEKWMNRNWDKSMVAGGIRITRRLFVAVSRPNLRKKKRIDTIEAIAQQWSLMPFDRVTA